MKRALPSASSRHPLVFPGPLRVRHVYLENIGAELGDAPGQLYPERFTTLPREVVERFTIYGLQFTVYGLRFEV